MTVIDLAEVSKTISCNDGMFLAGHEAHYYRTGQSALKNIQAVLSYGGNRSPADILDLPCGHGRVLRYLKLAFPQAAITACDLDRSGVDFCAETFGVKGVYSKKDLTALQLGQQYDLIWCGSLLTHLDQGAWADCLGFFEAHLKPEGHLVFTTHGRFVYERIKSRKYEYGGENYGLAEAALAPFLAVYETAGFSYLSYEHASDYGVSVASPGWVMQQIERFSDLKITAYIEKGWDNHQDVVACQKSVGFLTP